MKLNKLFAFVAALAVVGCTNEMVEDGIITNNDEVLGGAADTELVISASLGEEESKATIRYGESERDVFAMFEAQDCIGTYLHHEGLDFSHLNVKFEAESAPYDSDDDDVVDKIDFKAEESSMLLQPGVKLYAYYPYENGNTIIEGTTKATQRGGWNGTRQFTFDPDQSIENDSIYGKLDENILMISTPVEITMGEDNSYKADVKFRFANSFATLHIANKFTRKMTVKSVKVQMKSGDEYLPLTGNFVYDFDHAGTAEKFPFTPVENKTYDYVSANLDNMIEIPAGNTDRVCIPMVIAPVQGVTQVITDVYTEDGDKDYFFRIFTNVGGADVPRAFNVPIGINLTEANRYDDDYVHIYDYASLKNYIQNGANPNAKVYIDNDIDCAGQDPIEVNFQNNCAAIVGNAHKSYDNFAKHTVYGNDKTISNVTIVNNYQAAGFMSAGYGNTIENLTFANWTIKQGEGVDDGYNGVVMGATHGATLTNVHVINSSVEGDDKVAGLIGFAAGAETANGYDALLVVDGCSVEGTKVTANNGVGAGLIGFLQSYTADIKDSFVKNVTVDAKEKANNFNGLYIGTIHTGMWSTSGTPLASITINISGDNLIQGANTLTEDVATRSAYWTNNYQNTNALIGGLRDAATANAVVKMEGYTFTNTKPAIKDADGKYYIFNELNFVNLTANHSYAILKPLDRDVVLVNDIECGVTKLDPIYLSSQDAGINNSDWYVFDGNGKTLSKANFYEWGNNVSMFAANTGAMGNLEVKDLTIENCVATGVDGYAAMLVAHTGGALKVSNVTFKNNHVSGGYKVGLIAGYVQPTCALNAQNITIDGADLYATEKGQIGALVGYAHDSTVIDGVTVKGTVRIAPYFPVWNGVDAIPGYVVDGALEGRTFGKYIGTIGKKAVQGTNIVLKNVPAADDNFLVHSYNNANVTKPFADYAAEFNVNSFNYYIGGWDTYTTEEDIAIINGSKPFHAKAYNLWNAETLKLRGAQFDTRNLYVTHDIDYKGDDFMTMLARNNVFDGQGCTISNINYVEAPMREKAEEEYGPLSEGMLGLFAPALRKYNTTNITSHANVVVKNLTLKNVTALNGDYVSAVIAQANDDSTGYNEFTTTLIDNVHVIGGELSGYSRTGGLVAFIGNLGNVTHTVEIKNSSVQGVEMTNDIVDPTGEDDTFDGGQIGGLVGLVNKGALTIDNSFVKDITIDLRGTENVANQETGYRAAGYLVGVFAGANNARSITITNSYVDNAIDAATPWKVNRVGSKIISTHGDDYALSIANNTEYTTYGTLLGGWKTAGGSVKINGIEYDKAYKGIYSIEASKAGVLVNNVTDSSEKAWFGSIKQAYDRANDTAVDDEVIAIVSNYDPGRNYYEPYTKFEDDKVRLNLNGATVHGQLYIVGAELSINKGTAITTTFTNNNAYTGHEYGFTSLNGDAIVMSGHGKLEVENAIFNIKDGYNAISTANYTNNSANDCNKAIAGIQAFDVLVSNSTFNGNKAIDARQGTQLVVETSTFNNIENYAIRVSEGASVAYVRQNKFNKAEAATNSSAISLGARVTKAGSKLSLNQVYLGTIGDALGEVDDNTYTTDKHHTAETGVVQGTDYIVAIIADIDAAMRK